MAIAFESVSTGAFVDATSIVITKPTGLAEGDLMVAILGSDETDGFNTPSGWTALESVTLSSPDTYSANVFYKVADAGDVAASDFTFSPPDQAIIGGGILRISGAAANFVTDTGTSTSNVAVYTGGVTPLSAETLMIICGVNGSQLTTSGYNITTDVYFPCLAGESSTK